MTPVFFDKLRDLLRDLDTYNNHIQRMHKLSLPTRVMLNMALLHEHLEAEARMANTKNALATHRTPPPAPEDQIKS